MAEKAQAKESPQFWKTVELPKLVLRGGGRNRPSEGSAGSLLTGAFPTGFSASEVNYMNFYGKLKSKFQRYAIDNLALYAALTFGLGWLLISTPAGSAVYTRYLMFFPREVLHGQIWRIVTAFLYPPFAGSSILMAFLGIYIYYNFASIVERMMGSFDFNVYFFGSFLIGELGSILYYILSGIDLPYLPIYTQFAVFMAFAILYPDTSVLLMFILPIKTKYLALAELAIYLYNFVLGDSYSRVFGMLYTRINIIAALIPVGIFYLFINYGQNGGNIIGNIRWKMHQKRRQKEWRDQWR